VLGCLSLYLRQSGWRETGISRPASWRRTILLGTLGLILNAVDGVVLGILYLASGRNLWLAVIQHGVAKTIGFVLLYLGLSP